MPRNIKILLSYDGGDYAGWQKQPDRRTIQQELEAAIHTVTCDRTIRANASGRTDSGVHAVGQVVNFLTESKIAIATVPRALNAHLPDDIVVRAAEEMPEAFDANRDAIRKQYRYVIQDGRPQNPFMRRYSCPSHVPLDVGLMAEAARPLVGTHDFHSFETEWPNRKSSVRTITRLTVNRFGEWIWIDVEADGFLYNMVRAIAGTLILVGRGYWPVEQVASILAAQDRTRAGPTAPAQGLFLMRVTYAP